MKRSSTLSLYYLVYEVVLGVFGVVALYILARSPFGYIDGVAQLVTGIGVATGMTLGTVKWSVTFGSLGISEQKS